ncbi:hypothetical protein [Phenylobacterium sp.]|uniref:hypothetical protein n=1 Tax=Phenylobacterium sp. TaxID=1871053 RepID=UPI00271A01A3|nr:hypothetical protein [Phenylobacterium sp.]MDO8802675.1 hypothetical protein [Phenylobacterium sp.]
MSNQTKLFATALTALLVAGPAMAQPYRPQAPAVTYREGMPDVNTPPPSANPDAGNYTSSSSFARWYAGAGRPTMLMFWNRQLIEDATSQYDSVQTTSSAGIAVGQGAAVRGRGWAASASSGMAASASESRQYQERMTDSSYGFRSNNFTRSVESSILNTFLSAGARIVDREAVIRKVSAKQSREDRMDIQYLETLAMGQGIQYLIEILPDDDASSPTGVTFTVKVTHLPTSTVRAQFTTSGNPPKGEAKWVAVNGAGFEKRSGPSRQTPQLIGAQVAYDTMTKLR